MAIQLQCITLIVRIKTIDERYLGGWEQYKIDHNLLDNKYGYYDENLYGMSTMNPYDMEDLINLWERDGYHTCDRDENGDPTKWREVCVVEGMFGGGTLPCDWIQVEDNKAFLKETP